MRESPSGAVVPTVIAEFGSGIPIGPGSAQYSITPAGAPGIPIVCDADAAVVISNAPGHYAPGGTFPVGLVFQAFTISNYVICYLINCTQNPITLPNSVFARVMVFPNE